jgi:hypothetical protein
MGEENEQIDYERVCSNLERENISLRLFILKSKNKGESFFAGIKEILSDSDNVAFIYGLGILLTFIVFPTISFVVSLRSKGNER